MQCVGRQNLHETANIKALNRRLGEELGFGPTGPRFKWMHSSDVFWDYRPNPAAKFQRRIWADILAAKRGMTQPMKVWMLCQWRPPSMTEEEFQASFHGRYRYPAQGAYYAHPETMLRIGELPDADTTNLHIAALKIQMGKTAWQHQVEADRDAQETQDAQASEWNDFVKDWEPAFQNYNTIQSFGEKPHVSYGGI